MWIQRYAGGGQTFLSKPVLNIYFCLLSHVQATEHKSLIYALGVTGMFMLMWMLIVVVTFVRIYDMDGIDCKNELPLGV